MKNDNKVLQLQTFRFIAFLLIFFWHVNSYVPKWFPHERGSANAVLFFFMLSGVVTGLSSYNREIKFSWKETWNYFIKKVKKHIHYI